MNVKDEATEYDTLSQALTAWGLSREAAPGIGHKAHQDAIFDIDANYVRLVDCQSDRIEEFPRVTRSQN
jgi:hypothetical protein